MNVRLCRQACAVMDCDFIGAHQFLTNAILWAGGNIADFELAHDDSEHRWQARGIIAPECTADNVHDVMAQLILAYHAQSSLSATELEQLAKKFPAPPSWD